VPLILSTWIAGTRNCRHPEYYPLNGQRITQVLKLPIPKRNSSKPLKTDAGIPWELVLVITKT